MAAKINENNRNISVQLDGVSKAIDDIANDIEREEKELTNRYCSIQQESPHKAALTQETDKK